MLIRQVNSIIKTYVNIKIKLNMSLFRGYEDIYAKRYEGLKSSESGYGLVCNNELEKEVTVIKKVCDEKNISYA